MNEPIEKTIGKQIAKIREKRGLKQANLAELVELAPETISRMERGMSIPSLKTLERIGEALRTPLKDFFSSKLQGQEKGNRREAEIAKVAVLLQNKEPSEIKMAYSLLKSLFEQLKQNFKPLKK